VRFAAKFEDTAERVIAVQLRRRGWTATAYPYSAYGGPQRVRVVARVLLTPADKKTKSRRSRRLPPGLKPFLSAEVPRARVTVTIGEVTCELTADREGHVDGTVDVAGLAPGWHDVHFAVEGSPDRTAGRLLVVDPAAPLGIVSDIDDTVLETGLTQRLVALRNTFLVSGESRLALPGAAALYQALLARQEDRAPLFYLSTGAWNLHPMLTAFLARTGFPPGPLLLTDWGPTGDRFFRSGQAHKRAALRQLLQEFPEMRWLLIGDSGQHDAQVYADIAREFPSRVQAIYVRDVGVHAAAKARQVEALATELAPAGVPMLLVADSTTIALHAQGLGLIDDAGVAAVRAAMAGSGEAIAPPTTPAAPTAPSSLDA
jgi:phosphatidate phosphatase APP1